VPAHATRDAPARREPGGSRANLRVSSCLVATPHEKLRNDGGAFAPSEVGLEKAMHHAYPHQLAAFVRERWDELHAIGKAPAGSALCTLPDAAVLERLLSTAYQATLLREEERPVTFRLIFGPPAAYPEEAGPPEGLHRLAFTQPRPFTEHELRRLSPAAKYHRSLVGVDRGSDGALVIWGILQSGPRWLDSVRGGRRSLQTLPASKLVVRGTGPGRIAVASGALTLGEIRAGQISAPSSDLFESKWLPAMFKPERDELLALHEQARRESGEAWAEIDPDLTHVLSQHMVRRIISTILAAHHGGTLIVLPSDTGASVTSNLLRMKYAFPDAEPRRRFRTLVRQILTTLASGGGAARVGWSTYAASTSGALASLDEAVFEVSHLVAGLADVDGAVVLTKRFEVLGFGAEIAGDFPDVRTVLRATDLEGEGREEETVEGVGTRHRSAYRLCSSVPGALVIVISQDGTVRFVTSKDGAVTYWDHVSVGSPDA
jgi:hypothetical protein